MRSSAARRVIAAGLIAVLVLGSSLAVLSSGWVTVTSKTQVRFSPAEFARDHIKQSPAEFEALLKERPELLTRRFPNNNSLLHAAVTANQLEHARILLDRGVSPNIAWEDGITPLHLAVMFADLEMIRLLLEAGADPRAAGQYGHTPISIARRKGLADKLEMLESHLKEE